MIKTNTNQTKQLAKEATDQLIEAVEAGKSEKLKTYLAMMGKFHRYSLRNVLLIGTQKPDASRVAGYGTWKKLGRQVKKGERAIRILAPMVRRNKRQQEEGEDQEKNVTFFKAACVWDVTQTDGKPLAEFAKVAGDPGKYTDRLKDYVASQGIKLEYSSSIGHAEGLSAKGRIILREGLSPAEEFSVLVHETSHELLHQSGEAKKNKTMQETEAEAVAFVVCQAVGLETNTAASDYIQLYDGKKETLLESLERIQQTAVQIINQVLPDQKRCAA